MRGIYYIEDLKGRRYIGSSADIDKRIQLHFRQLNNQSHHNVHLQRAYDKHGRDYFTWGVLEQTEFLHERETLYIDKMGYYNIGGVYGGDNLSNHPNKNAIINKRRETWQRNHDAGLHNYSSKFGEENSNWRGGEHGVAWKDCSGGCGKRIKKYKSTCHGCRNRTGTKNPFFGKKHSDETKQKLREQKLGNIPANSKKVSVEGVVFESATAAAREFGITAPAVLYRIKSSKYDWEYV